MTTPNEVAGLTDKPKFCPKCGDVLVESDAYLARIMKKETYWFCRKGCFSLSPTEATEPLVELPGLSELVKDAGDIRFSNELIGIRFRTALSSSISNAEAEDSGEVVQAGAKEPWEVLRDIVTPSPFSHNKAAWSIMLGLIQRDHRLAARQSPDSELAELRAFRDRIQAAIDFASPGNEAAGDDNDTERLLWHVEQVCGPLSEESTVIEGDDDRSILRYNFDQILRDVRLTALSSGNEVAKPEPKGTISKELSNRVENIRKQGLGIHLACDLWNIIDINFDEIMDALQTKGL